MARFHGVATKYLENYLGWRRLLERLGPEITPAMSLGVVLTLANHFQLLTVTLPPGGLFCRQQRYSFR